MARLVSTAVIAVSLAVVSFVQAATPASEIGDVGVFAIGAAVGALVSLIEETAKTHWLTVMTASAYGSASGSHRR